jgi:hypothetical protein
LADFFFKLKPPSRDEDFGAGMAAEKTSSPLQRDKDKSKEATKSNSKKTKVQIQLTDEC